MAAAEDTGQRNDAAAPRSGAKRKAVALPGFLQGALQSRHMMSSMRLKPVEGSSGAQSAALSAAAGGFGLGPAGGGGGEGPRSAPSAACLRSNPRTYIPVRTLPLIFAQRKRHLQQQKCRAQYAEPYQRRAGEGLLALPEDVLLKVVCSLTHNELRPLFQVSKALRTTLRNAVAYHFNYSTPSRASEEPPPPPALGERQRRPARTNVHQVVSRLSRGGRAASGHGSGAGRGSGRSAAHPRALDFADNAASSAAAAASRPAAVVAMRA